MSNELLEFVNDRNNTYEKFLENSLEELKNTEDILTARVLDKQIKFYKTRRDYYKKINELIQNSVLLSYKEINRLYGNLKYCEYKTEMFGNMFYVYKKIKRKFRKPKRINCIELCCACGIHKQTIIDILKSYNFKEV